MAMNRATPKYQATDVSSGQEAPKTASLSPTVLRVSALVYWSECSMTWTKHDVLCSYTSYCTVALEKKKKKREKKEKPQSHQ